MSDLAAKRPKEPPKERETENARGLRPTCKGLAHYFAPNSMICVCGKLDRRKKMMR